MMHNDVLHKFLYSSDVKIINTASADRMNDLTVVDILNFEHVFNLLFSTCAL